MNRGKIVIYCGTKTHHDLPSVHLEFSLTSLCPLCLCVSKMDKIVAQNFVKNAVRLWRKIALGLYRDGDQAIGNRPGFYFADDPTHIEIPR